MPLAQGFSCFGTGPLCLKRVWVPPKYSREIQLCNEITKVEQRLQGTSILLFSMKASLGGFSSLVKRGDNSVDRRACLRRVCFPGESFPWLSLLFLIGCSVRSLVATFDPLALLHLPSLLGSAFDFPPLIGRIKDLTDTLAQRFSTPLGSHIRYLHCDS